jgi:enamine deaminase RidA (YjgF/YER057c/UK114 family)
MAASKNDMLSSSVLSDLVTRLRWLVRRGTLLVGSRRVLVEGDSMAPAVVDGDRLLISRLTYHFAGPARGDIVLLRDPSRPGSECIKRILALPGETVRLDGLVATLESSRPACGDRPDAIWNLGVDQYFVVGDHLAVSHDSRAYGPVTGSAILGLVWYRYRSAYGRTGLLEAPPSGTIMGRIGAESDRMERRMEKEYINPPGLNKPPGYTHVVTALGGKQIFIAGQTAWNANGELVGPGDLRAQTVQAFENLKTALEAAGASFADVVKYTTFVVNYSPEVRPMLGEVREKYVPMERPPAHTLIGVQSLARDGMLIEIEATAVID